MSNLAFVLSGGAARGSLQVGALRALLEAGYQPDLLVGTSVGAVNAAHLAVRGMTLASLDELAETWRRASTAGLFPANPLLMAMQAFFNRVGSSFHRMQEFFVQSGLDPELRFGQIQGVRLFLVAADLNTGRPVLYGRDPEECVLDGILASTALPLWVPPLEKGERLLMDGGAVSVLPIEPAMSQGAAEIIALDLADPKGILMGGRGFLPNALRLMAMAEQRQIELELALASARGIPVHRIVLHVDPPAPLWDFSRTEELMVLGYEIARADIARWKDRRPDKWGKWMRHLVLAHKVPRARRP